MEAILNNILNYIILYSPVIVAILGEVIVAMVAIAKSVNYFKKASKEVEDLKESAEYKELKAQMAVIIADNAELRKTLNMTMKKLNRCHIEKGDDKDENTKQ